MPNPSDTFLEQLPLIEQIIRSVCRVRGMSSADAEEFAGYVRLKLIENDYAIIRKFKGRSAFGTFVTTVISRLLNDYRDHEWGRWRNSAEAKRLGEVAMELERLLVRDMRSFEEAVAEVVAKYPGTMRGALEEMAARFPKRLRRRKISLQDSEELISNDDDVAKAQTLARISAIVTAFIARLPQEDQLIFQLRFENDIPVPRIARSLHLDMQSVYRRLRRHFGDLRKALEKGGISETDVAGLTGRDAALLDFHLKIDERCPSNDEEEEDDPDGAPRGSA